MNRKKLITIILLLILIFPFNTFAKEKLKVLVIEINPILKSVKNTKLYKNNDGNPYVSEYFGFDKEKTLEELEYDLESMSHDYLNIEIVKKEYLDEFPTYTNDITLKSGNKAKRYDEETYIELAKSSSKKDKGDWYKFDQNKVNKPVDYSFDYEYLIKKFNLIERKNNNEFDQVWLNIIDPSATYETIMVGNNPYWVNGTPIVKECDNFIIATVFISRRDANLHAISHSFENVMSMVFNGIHNDYDKKYYDKTDIKYQELNLWEKFTLTDDKSQNNHAGVGNVHYPFNAKTVYDYTNKTSVYTNWETWLNYPNLELKFKKSNSNAWLKFEENLKLDSSQNKDPDRLYLRFWLYLFPHIDGYTEDGYYNNWWKYIKSLDYVESMKSNINKELEIEKNKEVKIDYTIFYKSKKEERVKTVEEGNNIHISGDAIKFEDGKLIGNEYGESELVIFRDGKKITYKITIINRTLIKIIAVFVSFIFLAFTFYISRKLLEKKKHD